MKRAPTTRRAAERLVQDIVSGWRCQVVHTAVQLALPDALAAGPRGTDGLAQALDCDSDGLARLLRALCSLGLLRQRADGRSALTAGGRLLCQDPGGDGPGLRSLALWWGGPLWPLWRELAYSVRTGQSARQKMTGESGYGYLNRDGALPAVFHDAQHAMTALVLGDLVQWPGWARVQSLVDVGGGHGQVALGVLAAHPSLQAVVMDQPHAQAGAQQAIARAGLAPRCRFEAGSFFEWVPAGADVYLLKSILHNWNDEACARILQRCAEAVPAHGRLLLVERVQPERLGVNARDQGVTRTDLNMLAGLGGRERTQAQYADLLAPVGFHIESVWPLSFEFSVVEAARS